MPNTSDNAPCAPAFPHVPAGTNVVAVGIDLESVSRVAAAIERHGETFLEKVFTPEEIALCRSRGKRAQESFAARWAAKEALSKALGTGIGAEFAFTDAAVLADERGAPFFCLSEKTQNALRERGAARALLSLTHAGGFAAAVVVLIEDLKSQRS